MSKEVYILSGLGADERVFKKINFEGFRINHIQWINPIKNESIENYASRLINLNEIQTKNPIIVGLSFGGILAVEIAKQIPVEKLIIIASAKNKKEIPFYFRVVGFIQLHKMLPLKLFKSSNFLTNWFFGAKSKSEILQLKQILNETDLIFLKWAIDKVVHWRNTTHIDKIVHIHGSSDRILSLTFVKYDVKINDGGHLMVLTKADELNVVLRDVILSS